MSLGMLSELKLMRKAFDHVKFTYRLKPRLKRKLEISALKNGRLLSQEITHRLEQSFKAEKELSNVT